MLIKFETLPTVLSFLSLECKTLYLRQERKSLDLGKSICHYFAVTRSCFSAGNLSNCLADMFPFLPEHFPLILWHQKMPPLSAKSKTMHINVFWYPVHKTIWVL